MVWFSIHLQEKTGIQTSCNTNHYCFEVNVPACDLLALKDIKIEQNIEMWINLQIVFVLLTGFRKVLATKSSLSTVKPGFHISVRCLRLPVIACDCL